MGERTRSDDRAKRFVFVMMPFDPEFKSIYEDLIAPAFESPDYDVKRADSFDDQQNILKDIVRSIYKADLIIAELTSLNPNVMYELGIAHGLNKPTILLSQSLEEIPFDLQPYRVIIYSTHFREALKLKNTLKNIASKFDEKSIDFGNPVSDFSSCFFLRSETIETTHQSNEIAKLEKIPEEETPGLLDYLSGMDQSIQDISRRMDSMTGMTVNLNNNIANSVAEFDSVKENGKTINIVQLHKVVKTMSNGMIQYANDVETELSGFHKSWDQFRENTINLISVANIANEDNRQAILNLKSQMEEFRGALIPAISQAKSGKESFSKLKEIRISKDLNRAILQTEKALDGIIEELILGESYISRILNLIQERLTDNICGDLAT